MTVVPTVGELLRHRKFVQMQLHGEIDSHVITKEENIMASIQCILFMLLSCELGMKNQDFLLNFSNPEYIAQQTRAMSDKDIYDELIRRRDRRDRGFVGSLISIAGKEKVSEISYDEFVRRFG